MTNKETVVLVFLKLINAEVAEHVDDLPCKAVAMRSEAILILHELVKDDLNLDDCQRQQLERLKQFIS